MAAEVIDLILHQSDQRGHHQRDPLPHQRRQLVAERLPCPRREDCKSGAPIAKRLDHFPLSGTEFGISESLFQNVQRVCHESVFPSSQRRGIFYSWMTSTIPVSPNCVAPL